MAHPIQLDLHEANERLQNDTRSANDSQAIKKQLEEQMKVRNYSIGYECQYISLF